MISIVIPIYNAAKYLERCLQSIENQTYSDFEVLMINDGSEDNSKDICEKYVNKDSRFVCISQNNQGPDMARRRGTQIAKGEFLMFVDADDYIDERLLSVLVEKIINTDADIVCSNVTRFNNKGRKWNSDNWVTEEIECQNLEKIFTEYFVYRHIVGCYYAKLYKTELFNDYEFVKDSLIGEDITGVLNALKKAKKVIILPESFYFYCWNLSSISHSKYNRRHKISLENYIALRNEMLEFKLIEPKYICGYFAEFMMAVATAMSRARVFDKVTAELLRDDLRKYKKDIRSNHQTPYYMKICILCYIFSPKLFIGLYRIVYRITGR